MELASLRAHDRLDVDGPAPARFEDLAAEGERAGRHEVEVPVIEGDALLASPKLLMTMPATGPVSRARTVGVNARHGDNS